MSETVVYSTSGDGMIRNRLMKNHTGNYYIEHARNVQGSQPIRMAVDEATAQKIIAAEGVKAFNLMESEVAHSLGGRYDPS